MEGVPRCSGMLWRRNLGSRGSEAPHGPKTRRSTVRGRNKRGNDMMVLTLMKVQGTGRHLPSHNVETHWVFLLLIPNLMNSCSRHSARATRLAGPVGLVLSLRKVLQHERMCSHLTCCHALVLVVCQQTLDHVAEVVVGDNIANRPRTVDLVDVLRFSQRLQGAHRVEHLPAIITAATGPLLGWHATEGLLHQVEVLEVVVGVVQQLARRPCSTCRWGTSIPDQG